MASNEAATAAKDENPEHINLKVTQPCCDNYDDLALRMWLHRAGLFFHSDGNVVAGDGPGREHCPV